MKTSLSITSLRIAIIATLMLLLPTLIMAQWGPVRNITPASLSAGLNENAGPCLAQNGTTLHVVYSDHRTQGWAIYYQQSPDSGTTWTQGIAITDTMGKATMPVIAVWGDTIHVVWMDTLNGIRASYYKQSLDNGTTWSPNVCLDTNTKFWPGVAVYGQMVVATLNKAVTVTNTEVFIRISMDNGATWGAEQQISNADGRSEDPAIALQGSQIHLSWNDKRSGTMLIYYRHSMDAGLSWGPETALTTSDSYSSMVSVNGAFVDVPCGKTMGTHFHVFMNSSIDSGNTFPASQLVTLDSLGDAYPYLMRNGMELFMVFLRFGNTGGPKYIHSNNGGISWDSAISFGPGGQPFILYTDCALHIIFSDSGHIRYVSKSLCATSGSNELKTTNQPTHLVVYPNPSNSQTTFELTSYDKNVTTEFKIFDVLGQEIVATFFGTEGKIILDRNKFTSGIYFYKAMQKEVIIATGKVLFSN